MTFGLVTVGNLPKTQYIAQDKTSKLVCDIQGYPRSEISWLKAGKQVKGSRFKQDFFGSLRINNATKEDLGRYTCSVMQKVPSRTNSNTEDLFETFAIEVKMSGKRNSCNFRSERLLLKINTFAMVTKTKNPRWLPMAAMFEFRDLFILRDFVGNS